MRHIMQFSTENIDEEFYPDSSGNFGLALITYDKEKYLNECDNFKSCIVNFLDENNQVEADLDLFLGYKDGSFKCYIKHKYETFYVEGHEDYILSIRSI